MHIYENDEDKLSGRKTYVTANVIKNKDKDKESIGCTEKELEESWSYKTRQIAKSSLGMLIPLLKSVKSNYRGTPKKKAILTSSPYQMNRKIRQRKTK